MASKSIGFFIYFSLFLGARNSRDNHTYFYFGKPRFKDLYGVLRRKKSTNHRKPLTASDPSGSPSCFCFAKLTLTTLGPIIPEFQ